MSWSGTTGQPKCIVHGAGGVLLQHKKVIKNNKVDVERHIKSRLLIWPFCHF